MSAIPFFCPDFQGKNEVKGQKKVSPEQFSCYHHAEMKQASVSNGGYPVHFEVEWMEEGGLITLIGSKQPTAYNILRGAHPARQRMSSGDAWKVLLPAVC